MSIDSIFYKLQSNNNYVTSVEKAYKAKYADPLTLNFKLLINFDKNYGLLADEKYENSALAYLKRIGDEVRYTQLKNWIGVLEILNKDYDFLLLTVEGLDIVKNAKPYEAFNADEDKITLTFRETSDMMIESLIATYRHIFYDDIRGVEVLPSNLIKFDISILIFSGGYFNMVVYDDEGIENPDIERLIFPTKRKLNDNTFKNPMSEKFNHVLFNLGSCHIDITESGKMFIENVSNEPGADTVKNNLVFGFKFANYKGRFNNIMGDIDFVALLALMAAQNKAANTTEAVTKLKESLTDQLKDSWKSLKQSTIQTLKNKADLAKKRALSSSSVIGSTIEKFNVKYAEQLIKNTLDVGINYVEDKTLIDPLTKINNVLFKNFSNDLIGIYKNNFDKNTTNNNISLLDSESFKQANNANYLAENNGVVDKGVKLRNENIYTRTGF